jgi:branched-chain amino acid transport system permease protein
MGVRNGWREGLIGAGLSLFVIVIGVTTLTGTLLDDWFKLGTKSVGAWLVLLLIAYVVGSSAARRIEPATWPAALSAGVTAGLVHAVPAALLCGALGQLVANGVDLRQMLVQLTPPAIGLLTLGRSPVVAGVIMGAALFAASLAGAILARLRLRLGERLGLRSAVATARERLLETPMARSRYARPALVGLALILVLAMPFVLGQYWNYNLGTVGIYVILGLGLNVVVGMAGLLDLGYVAFFAVGAYTVAILTAPAPVDLGMSFWVALPVGVALACLAGVLLGIPVLRMRGDYLAIVTLGFGEIIRILVRSEGLMGFTGGPRGIRAVAQPILFGKNIGSEFYFMYFIIAGILLVMFFTRRLENSKVGRAWRAMREDETVAEAMGIYTLKYKLLAFATGAAFAGLSGVIFASRNAFTGPEDFTLLVSINVLALVIVGGMGSIPGVVIGALVLKGLPELLRQLQDYRILVFGALLVIMMIVRPQGLWPASRAMMERAKEAQAGERCDIEPPGDAQ